MQTGLRWGEWPDNVRQDFLARAERMKRPIRHDKYAIDIGEGRRTVGNNDDNATTPAHRQDRPGQRGVAVDVQI